MTEKEDIIFRAKLADQAERYEDMTAIMGELAKLKEPLTVEERNLLSVAYKNVIGARRSAWRALSYIDQKTAQRLESEKAENAGEEKSKGSANSCSARLGRIRTYKTVLEGELDGLCQEILDMLDNFLIPSADNEESKVFFYKMKGDYFRYMAEYKSDEERTKATEQSQASYQTATDLATASLEPTNAIRLGLALNFSVFKYEILDVPSEACELANNAFQAAITELNNLTEESYREATLILQLIRDNLTLWTSDSPGAEPMGGPAAPADDNDEAGAQAADAADSAKDEGAAAAPDC